MRGLDDFVELLLLFEAGNSSVSDDLPELLVPRRCRATRQSVCLIPSSLSIFEFVFQVVGGLVYWLVHRLLEYVFARTTRRLELRGIANLLAVYLRRHLRPQVLRCLCRFQVISKPILINKLLILLLNIVRRLNHLRSSIHVNLLQPALNLGDWLLVLGSKRIQEHVV